MPRLGEDRLRLQRRAIQSVEIVCKMAQASGAVEEAGRGRPTGLQAPRPGWLDVETLTAKLEMDRKVIADRWQELVATVNTHRN